MYARIYSWAVAALSIVLVSCAHEGTVTTRYQVDQLAGPSPFHGVHGLAVAPDGTLLAGSVVGQAIYSVDIASGEVRTLIGPPDGMADDIAFGPDGIMAWTGFLTGKVFVQEPGGEAREVASGLPGANSLAFTDTGRLYVTQVFLGDALHEVDWSGGTGARLIKEGLGGLNGFEIGLDGKIYGPLWFNKTIVQVDPRDGSTAVVADGFEIPAAVNFSPDYSVLYAIDTQLGELYEIDLESGDKRLLARLAAALDNLAVSPNGDIFVSNMADATIYQVTPSTGEVKTIVSGSFATPSDIVFYPDEQGGTLHIADVFAYRTLNPATGELRDPLRMYRDELENPLGIGVGPAHAVLTGWSTGTAQLVERKSGESKGIYHGFQGPIDAVEMSDGRVLVLESVTGSIVTVDPSVHETPGRQLFVGLEDPVAMIEGLDGAIFVTERSAGRIARVDLQAGVVSHVATDLVSPEGIDQLADGRLVVTEVDAGRVSIIDPSTGAKSIIAEGLALGLPTVPGTPAAYITSGVAVNRETGEIYIPSDLTNEIYRLRPRRFAF